MQLERKRAMQRIALGDAAGGKGADGSGSGSGLGLGAELRRTVVCETVPWLGVIKPRGAHVFLPETAKYSRPSTPLAD